MQTLTASVLSFGVVSSAVADLWQDFYGKDRQPAPAQALPFPPKPTSSAAACLKAIFDAQDRYGIPENLLLAIGIQEAGRNSDEGLTVWPWAANANGEGKYFRNKEDALNWISQKQAEGITNIDVGCMQINQKWHGAAFSSVEDALDPIANVDYAARFLSDLYASEKDWIRAAGRYHSSTPKYQRIYLDTLERNLNVANANVAQLAQLALREPPPVQVTLTGVIQRPVSRRLWSSASDAGQLSYSLYSNNPVLPILPNLQEAF